MFKVGFDIWGYFTKGIDTKVILVFGIVCIGKCSIGLITFIVEGLIYCLLIGIGLDIGTAVWTFCILWGGITDCFILFCCGTIICLWGYMGLVVLRMGTYYLIDLGDRNAVGKRWILGGEIGNFCILFLFSSSTMEINGIF